MSLRARIERGLSLRGLVTLTAVALLLRVVACWVTGAFETPSGRWEHGYEVGAVAVSLAEGRGFSNPFLSGSGPTAAVGPALPWVWSLLLRVFGAYSAAAWTGFVLLNALFSALVVPAVHALGRRCAGPGLGLLAALAWALHPVGVFGPTGYQSASGLFALFVTLTLERLVAIEQADGEGLPLRRLALTAGVCFGAGLWVEPLLLPVWLLWLGWALVRRRVPLLRAGLVASLLAAAIATPWFLRNLVVMEAPVFLRSWAGPELYLGAVAGPGEPTPIHLHPTRSPEEMRELIRVGEVRYARDKGRDAMALIVDDPGRWVSACSWRYAAFWLGRLSWWGYAPDHPVAPGLSSLARGFVFLVPTLLAVVGLWRTRGRRPAAVRVLLLAGLAYPVTYGLTHVEARYRYPLEPAITVAAVLALRRDGMLSGPESGETP